MLSLDEIIKHVEQVAYSNDDKALVCMGIKEYRELAELLRELQERRKAPEIVRCKDCKYYEWMSNRIPEEQTWHCHCWDADTGKDDYCSYAERRTDDIQNK